MHQMNFLPLGGFELILVLLRCPARRLVFVLKYEEKSLEEELSFLLIYHRQHPLELNRELQ